ncbi:Bro-N domain-containing protein, partial [Clostridioides difficile]|uniref:BRO-N domain-containing protein n=2 Tax=Clostridioides TaxID=1870884 RepID=UPI002350A9EF
MNELMNFEGKEIEVFEFEGQILFNPYDCGRCLELSDSAIRNHLSKMNDTQAILLKNSNVLDKDFRKLHNTGEKFLTESGVYKLIFKSQKEEAEKFQDWISDEVLPQIRQHGAY